MTRLLAVLTVGGLCVAAARADIGPPKGFKRIPIEHKILTEKSHPEYAFFTVSGCDKVVAIRPDPKTPVVVTSGGGRYRFTSLVAVPSDAGKKYATEKEFHAAVADGKVPGLVRAKAGFGAFLDTKDSDTRTKAVKEYRLEGVDANDGIILKPVVKDGDPKNAPDDESDVADDESPAAVYGPRGGSWVAGLAAAVAIALAGLWLVRRPRQDG